MSMIRYYDYDNNFVVTRIVGELSDQILVDHVIKLNKGVKRIPGFRELADCSEIGDMSGLSAPGTAKAASFEDVRSGSRLAILVGESQLVFGMARAYQAFSSERRQEVEIFRDKHQALEWLADGDSDLIRLAGFVEQCSTSD